MAVELQPAGFLPDPGGAHLVAADADAEGGHDVQQGGTVLCDLSREAPERGAVLFIAVGSRRPVRQFGACGCPREVVIEVDAEHAGLGLPAVTGGFCLCHDSSCQPRPAVAFAVPAWWAMLAWRGQKRSLAQREMKSAAEFSSRLIKPSSIWPPSPAASNSGLASPV